MSWTRVVLVGIVVAAALVALAVVLAGEPPAQTITGTVTSLEPHRICVTDATQAAVCAHVDAPQRLTHIERGDCVRIIVSADEQLEDLRSADACP